MTIQLNPSVLHDLQRAFQASHERPDFRAMAAAALKDGSFSTTGGRLAEAIRSGAVPTMSVGERLALQLRGEA